MKIGFPREKLRDYYNRYRYQEITFDKDTVTAVGLIRRDVYIALDESRYPAEIQRASMTSAEVASHLPYKAAEKLKQTGKLILNFSFIGLKSLLIPISFGVSYKLAGNNAIIELEPGSFLLMLNLDDAPPGYLIGTIGELIRSRLNETKRKEERIAVNADSSQRLGLKSHETHFLIGETKMECVLRDISFSGSKIIVQGRSARQGSEVRLELFFRNPDMHYRIPGSIVRFQPIPGSTRTYSAGIRFKDNSVPREYKDRLHTAFDTG
jgi:hypothetical protein